MLVYKMDVLKALKEKGYSSYVLLNGEKKSGGLIGSSAIQKLRKGYVIGVNVLDLVCEMLEMQPGDIIEYVPDDKYKILFESGYYKEKGIPAVPLKDKDK